MDNHVEQGFDFQGAEQKIKELQTFKTALSYEISKNQQTAEELRNRIKFLEEKINEHKQLKESVLKEVEAKIAESELLNSELRKLRIQYEHEKNDMESMKKSFENDRNTFKLEQASWKERSEFKEQELSRREVAIGNLEKETKYKLNEADARLAEIFKREEKISNLEKSSQDKSGKTELTVKESEILKLEAQKMLDEAASVSKITDEKMVDLNKYREEIIQREHILKSENNLLLEGQRKLKKDEREVTLEMNKLQSIRDRLLREIDNSSLEPKFKSEFVEEVKEEITE